MSGEYRDDTLSADRYTVLEEDLTPEPDTCWVHYVAFADGTDCPDCVREWQASFVAEALAAY